VGIKYFFVFMAYFEPKDSGFIIPPEVQIQHGGSNNNQVESE